MFDMQMLTILLMICIPGLVFMVKAEDRMLLNHSNENEYMSIYLRIAFHFVIILIFALMGAAFAPKVQLNQFIVNFPNALLVGVICSVVHLLGYYTLFRNHIDKQSFEKIEEMRSEVGFCARIFYAGFVEEIIFRWGLISFSVWMLEIMVGMKGDVIIWISILFTSILFGLAHIPNVFQAKVKMTPSIFLYVMLGNLWVGILCGWQFWTNGIFAAIIVHIFFHLLLLPAEKVYRQIRL